MNGIDMSSNPTDGQTHTIGADVYEFVDTGVDDRVTADGNIGVVIGGSAAATFANFFAAMNQTVATPHPTLRQTDGVTPALSRGTEDTVAIDGGGQYLLVAPADAPGGSVAIGPGPSLAFASTTGSSWLAASLNLIGGHSTGRRQVLVGITITAAHLAANYWYQYLGWTPTLVQWQVLTSSGKPKDGGNALVAIETDRIILSCAVGFGGLISAGDRVTIWASE
jgi:hypothetical protein